jgi:hypothetical protein
MESGKWRTSLRDALRIEAGHASTISSVKKSIKSGPMTVELGRTE